MAASYTLRRLAVPAAIAAACAWCATSVLPVSAGRRAIMAERVLKPGWYLRAPWPWDRVQRVEFGQVHEIAGGGDFLVVAPGGAQALGAGLRVVYRVGMADSNALAAVHGRAAAFLVQHAATREAGAYFAARTLEDVLGADRGGMEGVLRRRLQARLDQAGAGLEVIAVVMDALRPPAAATGSIQAERTAEMGARAAIGEAHGQATASLSGARQQTYAMVASAQAEAAEIVDQAQTSALRFAADQQAARAGGTGYLLERYLAALGDALKSAPKTIIDHRLNYPEPPVLDLRPLAAAATGGGKEE